MSHSQIFRSAPTVDEMQKTLFKPLVAQYLRIEPINDKLGSKVSVSIYGCGMYCFFCARYDMDM